MALNDEKLTEKIKKAYKYFSKLPIEPEVRVEDGEMIEAAAYVALPFAFKGVREEICKKLEEKGISLPLAVHCGVSSCEVMNMCKEYAEGKRVFDRYPIEQAERLCHAFLIYLSLLECEKKRIEPDSLKIMAKVYEYLKE